MPTRNDGDLMRQVRDQRPEALEQLYDRHSRLVYSLALRACRNESMAREVVQLVFTRIWTTKAEYDAGKGAFTSWIVTMTRHIAIDVMRKEKRHSGAIPMDEMTEKPIAGHAGDPESALLRMSDQSAIASASRGLSDAQRRVIDMLYWKGYTLQEIAELGGEPVGTVKNRLHQALKTLRRHLQGLREER